MLDKVDLGMRLAKEDYKLALDPLQDRLYALEWACWKQGVPTAIVFEGWGGAGKGEVIRVLTERLDPRGCQVHPVVPPSTEESMKPWMARFWAIVPGRGEMAVFDRSWYGRVLWSRLAGQVSDRKLVQAYMDIREFESMLADDGTIFIKFWLHVSEEEQRRRLKKMEKDPLEAWKVSQDDWWQNKHYGKVVKAVEQMLDQTSAEYARWHVIPMEDKHFGRIRVLETVADSLLDALVRRGLSVPPQARAGAKVSPKENGEPGREGGPKKREPA